jgi:L-methionine (R)-S-oxide reductase
MGEEIIIDKSKSKEEIYQTILPQLEALIKNETDLIANLANIAAVLKMSFNFFWVGFYLVKNNALVLGPFQGPIACTRILLGQGVCGQSWEQKMPIIVPDVGLFPGHITCSSDSKSEIVIPKIKEDNVLFVLDVDSDVLNSFDEIDAHYLTKFIALI